MVDTEAYKASPDPFQVGNYGENRVNTIDPGLARKTYNHPYRTAIGGALLGAGLGTAASIAAGGKAPLFALGGAALGAFGGYAKNRENLSDVNQSVGLYNTKAAGNNAVFQGHINDAARNQTQLNHSVLGGVDDVPDVSPSQYGNARSTTDIQGINSQIEANRKSDAARLEQYATAKQLHDFVKQNQQAANGGSQSLPPMSYDGSSPLQGGADQERVTLGGLRNNPMYAAGTDNMSKISETAQNQVKLPSEVGQNKAKATQAEADAAYSTQKTRTEKLKEPFVVPQARATLQETKGKTAQEFASANAQTEQAALNKIKALLEPALVKSQIGANNATAKSKVESERSIQGLEQSGYIDAEGANMLRAARAAGGKIAGSIKFYHGNLRQGADGRLWKLVDGTWMPPKKGVDYKELNIGGNLSADSGD